MIKISIIIPVYNNENYVRDAINSVLMQSYAEWEMILVDDGSTDESGKICDEYSNMDSRVICIHKKNEGVSVARKTGVERSTGDYLLFMDCDDWLIENCLESLSDGIRETRADIVAFGFIEEDERGRSRQNGCSHHGLLAQNEIKNQIWPYLIQNQKAGYYRPSLCGSAFRRSLIKENMIADSRATVGEDGACVIPAVYQAGSMLFLDQCFYHYRYNPDSATKGHKAIPPENARIIAEHISKRIDLSQADFQDQLYRKITHDVFNICISRFYTGKSYRMTSREIIRTIREPSYWQAIRKARFSGNIKVSMAHIILRYHLVFLLWVFSRIR